MDRAALGPLAWKSLEALTAHYGPAIDGAAEGFGIPLGEWYGWLMAAHIFEPDPVTAKRLQVRSAYTSPTRLEEYLAKGARLGLLEQTGPGEYRLNAAGRDATRRLIQTAYDAMAPLRPLPEGELERLAGLLDCLVQASLAAPEPPGKWCLRIARHYDPGKNAPAMVRIDQYLSDLYAYRDDAHLASWRPLGVSGPGWEALTFLWRGEAATAGDLAAKLKRRGYTQDNYGAALQELAGRGWVEGSDGTYRLTDQGRDVRERAEAATEDYFYAPWNCLSEAELAELSGLLVRFCEGLPLPQ